MLRLAAQVARSTISVTHLPPITALPKARVRLVRQSTSSTVRQPIPRTPAITPMAITVKVRRVTRVAAATTVIQRFKPMVTTPAVVVAAMPVPAALVVYLGTVEIWASTRADVVLEPQPRAPPGSSSVVAAVLVAQTTMAIPMQSPPTRQMPLAAERTAQSPRAEPAVAASFWCAARPSAALDKLMPAATALTTSVVVAKPLVPVVLAAVLSLE